MACSSAARWSASSLCCFSHFSAVNPVFTFPTSNAQKFMVILPSFPMPRMIRPSLLLSSCLLSFTGRQWDRLSSSSKPYHYHVPRINQHHLLRLFGKMGREALLWFLARRLSLQLSARPRRNDFVSLRSGDGDWRELHYLSPKTHMVSNGVNHYLRNFL